MTMDVCVHTLHEQSRDLEPPSAAACKHQVFNAFVHHVLRVADCTSRASLDSSQLLQYLLILGSSEASFFVLVCANGIGACRRRALKPSSFPHDTNLSAAGSTTLSLWSGLSEVVCRQRAGGHGLVSVVSNTKRLLDTAIFQFSHVPGLPSLPANISGRCSVNKLVGTFQVHQSAVTVG